MLLATLSSIATPNAISIWTCSPRRLPLHPQRHRSLQACLIYSKSILVGSSHDLGEFIDGSNASDRTRLFYAQEVYGERSG